jgi:hypothetical protein
MSAWVVGWSCAAKVHASARSGRSLGKKSPPVLLHTFLAPSSTPRVGLAGGCCTWWVVKCLGVPPGVYYAAGVECLGQVPLCSMGCLSRGFWCFGLVSMQCDECVGLVFGCSVGCVGRCFVVWMGVWIWPARRDAGCPNQTRHR